MKTMPVKVQPNHLQCLANVKKPILALAELVWNSLDADAAEASVSFEDNGIRGFE
jgi:DNA mismatch repair ATPase MutL